MLWNEIGFTHTCAMDTSPRYETLRRNGYFGGFMAVQDGEGIIKSPALEWRRAHEYSNGDIKSVGTYIFKRDQSSFDYIAFELEMMPDELHLLLTDAEKAVNEA